MGRSPKTSATNPEGETGEARHLFVMDGSSLPNVSGVNPLISMEARTRRSTLALAAGAGM